MTTDSSRPATRSRLTWRTAFVAAAITAPGALVVDIFTRTMPERFEFAVDGRMTPVSIAGVIIATAVAFVIGCRPWRLLPGHSTSTETTWRTDMRPVDRARVAWAVARYDFWLEWYDTPLGRRKPARRELRANLEAAAQHGSAAQAVSDLGGIRTLAAETAAGLRRSRPTARLTTGGLVAGGTLVVFEVLLLVAVTAFADGAMATGEAGKAVGRVLGNPTTVMWSPEEFSVDVTFSPVMIIVPLVIFVVVAQPWRLLRRPIKQSSPA